MHRVSCGVQATISSLYVLYSTLPRSPCWCMKSLFMGDVARSITREPRDGETQRAETRLSFYSLDVKRPGINNRRIRGKKSRKVRPRRALFSPLSFIVSPFSTSVCFRGSRVHVEENVDTIVRSKQLSLSRERAPTERATQRKLGFSFPWFTRPAWISALRTIYRIGSFPILIGESALGW